MDGLTLAASAAEIKKRLIGGKIEKIQQPDKYELLFTVRAAGKAQLMLISASPDNCRIQLTNNHLPSPVEAPMFLMLLRKHLLNARIVSVHQPNTDRIVVIEFDALNEFHDAAKFALICEIMGRYSNIILVDGEGNIIDSVKRVTPSMSSVRFILPKLKYAYPPTQEKLSSSDASAADFSSVLENSKKPEKAISHKFYGLSPAVSSLLLENCGFNSSNSAETAENLVKFYKKLISGEFTPCILHGDKKIMLLPFAPEGYRTVLYPSMSEAADAFYSERAENERLKRLTYSLDRIIANNIKRLERRLDEFTLTIGNEAEIEKYRLYGEILTANAYALPKRCDNAVLPNFYSETGETVDIPLDKSISPQANAQLYFKRYRKAKTAFAYAVKQQEEILKELEYFSGLASDLEKCTSEPDIEQIRAELKAGGYIKPEPNAKKVKLPKAKPHIYLSEDGIEICVGKNNTQNDFLTFKLSSPEDTWLHVKDIHGSHVIIRHTDEIPEKTLLQAAKLAAYYSQSKGRAAVPVDYTKRKYVKKPSGANPGMVIYTHQHTVYVETSKEEIDSFSKKD